MRSDPELHDIEALAETELCRFGTDAMQRLGTRFPHLQGKLLERACVELDSAREQMMSLARMTPTERVADFLLKLAGRQARTGDPGPSIALPMPRADIADHLGLTVETVSRCLTALRTRGLIALPGTYRVEILDPQGGRRTSEPYLQEAQEQAEGVAIGGDGMGTRVLVRDESLSEEALEQRGKGRSAHRAPPGRLGLPSRALACASNSGTASMYQ